MVEVTGAEVQSPGRAASLRGPGRPLRPGREGVAGPRRPLPGLGAAESAPRVPWGGWCADAEEASRRAGSSSYKTSPRPRV